MVGGLLNLIAQGQEDMILTGNPTKTFFKKTFKRYNNFGQQKFRINMEGRTQLNLHSSSTYSFKIPRYGDFLQQTFLCLNLPNIWSPILSNNIQFPMCSACRSSIQTPGFVTSNVTPTHVPPCWKCGTGCTTIYKFIPNDPNFNSKINFDIPYEFKWINELGFMIIERITVNANSVKLQEYTGQYLSNMIKRDFVEEQQRLISKMIGNTADLNNPALYANRKANYPNAAYFGSMNDRMKYGLEPSIRGKKLYIPLNILGTLLSKTAIPLVSMQYSELNIQITLKPVYDWFVVKDMNFLSRQLGFRAPDFIEPLIPIPTYIPIKPFFPVMGSVTTDPDDIVKCNKGGQTFVSNYIKPDCNYEIYQMGIFLKEPPPKLCVSNNQGVYTPALPCSVLMNGPEAGTIVVPFPNKEVAAYYGLSDSQQPSGITNWFSDVHLVSEYIFMEDNARNEFANNCQSMLIRTIHEYDVYDLFGQQSTVLKSNGLVINWMWFFQRSDVGKRNQWTNYTNREYIDEIKTGIFKSIDQGQVGQLCPPSCPNVGSLNNLVFTDRPELAIEEIMLDWGFNLNSSVREINTIAAVSAYVDLYSRSNSQGKDGCYYYTFCLNTDPFVYQPSGVLNLSKFNTITWNYNLITPPPLGSDFYIDTLGEIFAPLSSYFITDPQQAAPSQMVPTSVTCDPDNPNEPITTVKNVGRIYEYTYTLHIMEERLNILVIENGIAGLALSN